MHHLSEEREATSHHIHCITVDSCLIHFSVCKCLQNVTSGLKTSLSDI